MRFYQCFYYIFYFTICIDAFASHAISDKRAEKEFAGLPTNNVLTQPAKESQLVANIIASVQKANQLTRKCDSLNVTSTNLFKKALTGVEKLNRDDLKLWVTSQYSFYLYNYRKYEDSFPVFVQTVAILDKIDPSTIIEPIETYKKTGFFLMTVGDDEKAIECLLKAKRLASSESKEYASIVDNLGLIFNKQNNLNKAESCFNEVVKVASINKDDLRYAKALGNIATIKFKQKKYSAAIVLLNKDVAISERLNNTQNTIYALVMLGKVYLADNNLLKAREILQKATDYAKAKVYLQSSDYEINELVLQIAKRTGNEKDELNARRNLESLGENLAQLDGQEVIRKVGWEMQKTTLNLTIEAEKAKSEKQALAKILALVTCCFLLMVIIFVIKSYRKKIKTHKTEFDAKIAHLLKEKNASDQKLSTNRQTIQSYKIYLREKTNQISSLEKEIKKLTGGTEEGAQKYVDEMQAILNSHLLNQETWVNFKKIFIENYPHFYQYLIENFEDLTDSNLRIIFLQKLELNNVEISNILGLTRAAVKKAKQRLRRKYDNKYEALFASGFDLD